MKSFRGWRVLLPLLLAVSGCKSLGANSCNAPQPYQAAKSVTPLKVPTGLDSPDTANALHIPALNEPPPPPRHAKDPCLDEPPAFKVRQPVPAPHA